ncbi:MAG: hypothetical protein K6E10_04225 [Eubacterium sp.]|nr:hypothetical protein [Eubacterium sp.]
MDTYLCQVCGQPLNVDLTEAGNQKCICSYCGNEQVVVAYEMNPYAVDLPPSSLPVEDDKKELNGNGLDKGNKGPDRGDKLDNKKVDLSPEEKYKECCKMLAHKDWYDALAYSRKMIKENPDFTQAYLLLLMADCRVTQREKLGKLWKDISVHEGYNEIMNSRDEELKSEVKAYFESAALKYVKNVSRTSADLDENMRAVQLLTIIPETEEALEISQKIKGKIDWLEACYRLLDEINANYNNKDFEEEAKRKVREINPYRGPGYEDNFYIPLFIYLKDSSNIFALPEGTVFGVTAKNVRARLILDKDKPFKMMLCKNDVKTIDIALYSRYDTDFEEPKKKKSVDIKIDGDMAPIIHIKNKVLSYSVEIMD